ncbi:unnamed protein product [Cylicocyclus nassatus]|uniref:Uncharacterized protein n=1 Tax=Cylicocyclus nassatus TaxID=53992 RepID=A0AA36M8I7_CYLNA|nr:unnamed protein product [Cylicocyclus nassatus]
MSFYYYIYIISKARCPCSTRVLGTIKRGDLRDYCGAIIAAYWIEFIPQQFAHLSAPSCYQLFKRNSHYMLHSVVQLNRFPLGKRSRSKRFFTSETYALICGQVHCRANDRKSICGSKSSMKSRDRIYFTSQESYSGKYSHSTIVVHVSASVVNHRIDEGARCYARVEQRLATLLCTWLFGLIGPVMLINSKMGQILMPSTIEVMVSKALSLYYAFVYHC